MLNRNFGFEMALASLFHSPVLTGPSSTDTINGYQYWIIKTKAKIISFIPALRFQAGDKKIHIFTRTGFIVGIPFDVIDEYNGLIAMPGAKKSYGQILLR
jgi:hypothetical protein